MAKFSIWCVRLEVIATGVMKDEWLYADKDSAEYLKRSLEYTNEYNANEYELVLFERQVF